MKEEKIRLEIEQEQINFEKTKSLEKMKQD